MVTVQIGNGPIIKQAEITEAWINQQISRRRRDAQSVCVKVTVRTSAVDILLATPDCTGVGTNRQVPTTEEKRILDLWVERGLNTRDFASGNLVAFLHHLEHLT